ncbi:uncharacterized protein [Lolium perenne]|uniref:uncharacterized protein isoform X3 n=1 Tax=Lolium perenne TaxID=4522 RepID=UPI003A9975FC
MLLHRIDRNILLSDVVGLVNKVTYVLPPSGNARSQKRQVYITDVSELAIVTLCGEHADLFDADGLIEASDEEPIIILFVGMTVSHCSDRNIYRGALSCTVQIKVVLSRPYHQSRR